MLPLFTQPSNVSGKPPKPVSLKQEIKIKNQEPENDRDKVFFDKVAEIHPDLPDGAEKNAIAKCLRYLGHHYIKNNIILNALRDNDFQIYEPKPIFQYNHLLDEHINRDCTQIPTKKQFLAPENALRIRIKSKECDAQIPIGLLTKAQSTEILQKLYEALEQTIAAAAVRWEKYQKTQHNTGL